MWISLNRILYIRLSAITQWRTCREQIWSFLRHMPFQTGWRVEKSQVFQPLGFLLADDVIKAWLTGGDLGTTAASGIYDLNGALLRAPFFLAPGGEGLWIMC